MKPAIIEDKIFEFEPFEEDGSVLMVAETPWRGMADELQELHYGRRTAFFLIWHQIIIHVLLQKISSAISNGMVMP